MNKEDKMAAKIFEPTGHETVGGSTVRLTSLMPARALLEIIRPNDEISRPGTPRSLFTGIDRGDARDIILMLEAWLKSDAPDDSVTVVDLADEIFARELVRRLNHEIESCESMRMMCDRALNEEGRWAPWMLGFVSTTLGSDLRIGLVQSDGGGFCGFELLRGDLPARDVVPGTSPVAKPTIADPLAVRVAALEGALEDLRLAKNREVETLESSVHVLDERLNDVENETCDMMYLSDATSRRITAGDDDKVLLGTVLEVITERLERLEGAADDASAEVKYKPEKKEKEERVVTGWLWKHTVLYPNPYGGENGWKDSVKAAGPFRTRVAAREFADRHGDVRNNILAGYTKLVPVTRKKKGGEK
jgi:hypothetical protein